MPAVHFFNRVCFPHSFVRIGCSTLLPHSTTPYSQPPPPPPCEPAPGQEWQHTRLNVYVIQPAKSGGTHPPTCSHRAGQRSDSPSPLCFHHTCERWRQSSSHSDTPSRPDVGFSPATLSPLCPPLVTPTPASFRHADQNKGSSPPPRTFSPSRPPRVAAPASNLACTHPTRGSSPPPLVGRQLACHW